MKNNLHIILVANTAWSLFNFRKGLIQALIAKGYRITIIAPQDDYFANKLIELGTTFIPIEMDVKGANAINDFGLFFKLFKCYKKLKPDIIFHYTIKPNIYGTLAARVLNIKNIAITTGLGYTFIENNLVSKIAHFLYRFSFKWANQIWFLNSDDKDVFLKKKLVSPKKVMVLNGEGIDLDYFSPDIKTDNIPRFTLISRLLWDKGVGEFVEAARIIKKMHPEVEFAILGFMGVLNPSAISEQQLEKWLEEKIVKYEGSSTDVRPFIIQSTAIVLPSYREGIPRTLLEASAMERPIITSDAVGCREVIEDGKTGFSCKVKDVTSLVRALEKMLALTKEEWIIMGKNGRSKMKEQFNENIIIEHYINTINNYFN